MKKKCVLLGGFGGGPTEEDNAWEQTPKKEGFLARKSLEEVSLNVEERKATLMAKSRGDSVGWLGNGEDGCQCPLPHKCPVSPPSGNSLFAFAENAFAQREFFL